MFPKICLSNWINQDTVIDIREEDCDFYDMLRSAAGRCQGAVEIGHSYSELIHNIVRGGAIWPHANCA